MPPRAFSPNELETLNFYMMKYRKYGIVELFDNELDGVYTAHPRDRTRPVRI